MISKVPPTKPRSESHPQQSPHHSEFLKMLPFIERRARFCFRDLDSEAIEEAVQETIANSWLSYDRLVRQGRKELANKTSLARYAVAQVRAGRRISASLNIHDVSSHHCQRRRNIRVQQFSQQNNAWDDVLVEDRHVTPADLAASRIDYPAFLDTLDCQKRRIAEKLATGETTSYVATFFGLSHGRISQLRRELKAAWERFHAPKNSLATALF